MTPEQARDIYHLARYTAMVRQADYVQPVNQEACDLAGWRAVIEAIQREAIDEHSGQP